MPKKGIVELNRIGSCFQRLYVFEQEELLTTNNPDLCKHFSVVCSLHEYPPLP
jgi:hypothetical protein